MVLKLFSGYLSLFESPLTSRVLPRLFRCALELCFCQDRCFWSFACGVVVGWGERGDTRAHLILYPRVCLITYIHGIAAAQLALSAHAKRCPISGVRTSPHSPARRTHHCPSRRCPAPLPVTRLMRRWRKQGGGETHGSADMHTAGETRLHVRELGGWEGGEQKVRGALTPASAV